VTFYSKSNFNSRGAAGSKFSSMRMRRQNPVLRGGINLFAKIKSFRPGKLLKTEKFSRSKKVSPERSLTNRLNGPKGKYRRRYGFIFKFFKFLLRQYKIFLTGFIVAFTLVGLNLLFRTDYFEVKEIRFEGVEQIEKEKLEQIADKYKGKNIYTIDLDEFEKDVDDLSVYIKGVYARKHLPSKIIVEITERYPREVFINFDGVYLVDKDNYVVSAPMQQSITFTDEEWEAYYSQDVNLKIVQERVKSDLDEEGQKNFDYKKIEAETKQKALAEIKAEMNQIIINHFNSIDKQINESDFAGFQRIYFYENAKYKEGDIIDNKALTYTVKVLEFFDNQEELTVSETIWESKFSLTVRTLEGKIFTFGANRDIDSQINDLEVVLEELKSSNKKYTRIDLRAEIIGVK